MAGVVKRKEQRPKRFVQANQRCKNKNLIRNAVGINLDVSRMNNIVVCGPEDINFNNNDLGLMSPPSPPTANNVSAKRPDWEDRLRYLVGCPQNVDVQAWLEDNSSETLNKVLLNLVEQNRALEAMIDEEKEKGKRKLWTESDEFVKDLVKRSRLLRTRTLKVANGPEIEEDGSGKIKILEFEKRLEAAGSLLECGAAEKESLMAKYEDHRAKIAALEFRKKENEKCFKDIVEWEIKSRQKVTTGSVTEIMERERKSRKKAKGPVEEILERDMKSRWKGKSSVEEIVDPEVKSCRKTCGPLLKQSGSGSGSGRGRGRGGRRQN